MLWLYWSGNQSPNSKLAEAVIVFFPENYWNNSGATINVYNTPYETTSEYIVDTFDNEIIVLDDLIQNDSSSYIYFDASAQIRKALVLIDLDDSDVEQLTLIYTYWFSSDFYNPSTGIIKDLNLRDASSVFGYYAGLNKAYSYYDHLCPVDQNYSGYDLSSFASFFGNLIGYTTRVVTDFSNDSCQATFFEELSVTCNENTLNLALITYRLTDAVNGSFECKTSIGVEKSDGSYGWIDFQFIRYNEDF